MLTTLAAVAGAIFTLAGNGTEAPIRDGAPAALSGLSIDASIAALPDGGFLVGQDARVWRVDPQGRIRLAAGTGRVGESGDGGLAVRARISVAGLAALPGGGFLFTDNADARVRMVGPDGVISTVAGGGRDDGEGVPARKARLFDPLAVTALPGGGFLVVDRPVVRRVGPDGRIRTVAGNGVDGEDDDETPVLRGQPATAVSLDVFDIAATPDGGILIADLTNLRVDRVSPAGAITVAADLPFAPWTVAALPDGGFLAGDFSGARLWRVGVDRSLTLLAGGGPFTATAPLGLQQRLSGESALGARLGRVGEVEVTPDGGALVSAGEGDIAEQGGRVGYITPADPQILGAALLRDQDRVLHPGGSVSVALTRPAALRLTVGRRSTAAALAAGVTRVPLPPTRLDRPRRVLLEASTPDGRSAFDALRLFPPHWLPTETAQLVAAGVRDGVLAHATRLEHCRRLRATRVDCSLTAPRDRCEIAAVAFTGGRLRWGARGCGSRPRVHLRALRRRDWSCGPRDSPCPPDLFGRLAEAALVPSR